MDIGNKERGYRPSDAPSRDEVLAHARASLGFLEGIASRPVVVDEGSSRTVLAYTIETITIEIELGWREGCAFLLLCRTVNGGRPPAYYMHDRKRMRVHLAQALDDGTENDKSVARELRKTARASGSNAIREQLSAFSTVIRTMTDRLPEFHDRLFPTDLGCISVDRTPSWACEEGHRDE